MSSGSVSGFAAESNAMSGTAFWAAAGSPARNVAASSNEKKRFMESLLLRTRCFNGGRLQDEFLHTPRFDFPDDDLGWLAAVHHVYGLESGEFLARGGEL